MKKKKLVALQNVATEATSPTPEVPHVKCPICGETEWVSVDEYRAKPEGMKLCTHCGFVTYPEIVANSEQLKEFYRKEYRPGPSAQNVYSGQRKLHYHANFLNDLFLDWKKKKLNCPDVFDVGAAFGMFLNMIRGTFPKARVAGSELTLSFRRVAYWEHQLQLVEEFDDSKSYDLIASYKVLEHQPHPDKELRRYALHLKDDGLLYISVPTWFHTMSNFGLDGFSLGYYYDKNHVNVWTRKLFETLLKKCGLEIVKSNFTYYDSTYLCKRNDSLMALPGELENPSEVIAKMTKIKKAAEFADIGEFDLALKEFPAFPDAIMASYEKNRAKYHAMGWEGIKKAAIEPALQILPDNHRILFFVVDLHMRYEKYPEALELLDKCLVLKPSDPASLAAVGNCLRAMADKAKSPKEAAGFLTQARDVMRELHRVSLQHNGDSVTWIFADDARIPMPGELPPTE